MGREMKPCDFCDRKNISVKRYAYKSSALKECIRVTICDECAEKEKANIVREIVKGE